MPVMRTLLALLCVGLVVVVWDLRLRVSYLLYGNRDVERFTAVQYRGLDLLMAAVTVYAGLRIRVQRGGHRSLPPFFMIVSNHQSLADIPILAYVFSERTVGFVAKKELRRGLPSFSFALRKGRHALIDRAGDFASAQRQLLRLARYAREGVCPLVFPEGTRSRTGRVGAFHSAAVRTILAATPMPVLSVAVTGGRKIARLKDLLLNLPNSLYRVKFLTLYRASGDRKVVKSILRRARREITQQVEQWIKTEN